MGHGLLTKDIDKDQPDFLKKINTKTLIANNSKPIIIKMSQSGAAAELKKLVEGNSINVINDNYSEQYAELLLSKDAHLYRANEKVQIKSIEESLKAHYGKTKSWQLGAWVYYPWNSTLVHILDEGLFHDLRTIRNRNLITSEQQKKLRDFNVACVGMSVGSSGALALGITGISQKIKIADGAVISGSNLNRILTGVGSIGLEKGSVIARKLYEMNPYSNIYNLGTSVKPSNIDEIFLGKWKIDLLIDEIDDLEMKIRLRLKARELKIPVIMATELADSVMLDVERYDTDTDAPLFHGLAGDIENVLLKEQISQREWMKYATTIIGPTNVPLDMQHSLLQIGSKVVTHPQLGSTVMMTGGALSYAVKKIALGYELKSCRKILSLDDLLLSNHYDKKHKKVHKKHTKILNDSLNSV